MPETTNPDGVQIDLISGQRMSGKTSMEKIRMILDGVRDGKIVVLETGLTPDEESKLIEVTMSEINPDDFTGIEIESFPQSDTGDTTLLGRLMGKGVDVEADGDRSGEPDPVAPQRRDAHQRAHLPQVMPHQCTNCGHVFADGSKEMLSGCPDCGGNKFQYHPGRCPRRRRPTPNRPSERVAPSPARSVAPRTRSATRSRPTRTLLQATPRRRLSVRPPTAATKTRSTPAHRPLPTRRPQIRTLHPKRGHRGLRWHRRS